MSLNIFKRLKKWSAEIRITPECIAYASRMHHATEQNAMHSCKLPAIWSIQSVVLAGLMLMMILKIVFNEWCQPLCFNAFSNFLKRECYDKYINIKVIYLFSVCECVCVGQIQRKCTTGFYWNRFGFFSDEKVEVKRLEFTPKIWKREDESCLLFCWSY